ncbi:DUF1488 domain-containing protein [Pararobbsia silviterrae]|nr:DUF1488 domain-containing protein [Pararobbsia silviterrae]
MRIEFPEGRQVWNGSELRVDFPVRVDNVDVLCSISAEALEDHFGAHSTLESDVLGAFERETRRIRALCRRALEDNHGQPVVLRSGLIRLMDAQDTMRGDTPSTGRADLPSSSRSRDP